MNGLGFAFEIVITGFIAVMLALFLLALILKVFSKVLKFGREGGEQIVAEPAKVIAKDEQVTVEEQQELLEQRAAAIPGLPGFIQPEVAAALAGVFQSMGSMGTTMVKPEIVAAATGAVLYVSEMPSHAGSG